MCEDSQHNFSLIDEDNIGNGPMLIYMFCSKCGKIREVTIPDDSDGDWDVNETADD